MENSRHDREGCRPSNARDPKAVQQIKNLLQYGKRQNRAGLLATGGKALRPFHGNNSFVSISVDSPVCDSRHLGQIQTFLPLQKLLFLTNIYIANYFATLMFANFILAIEPMEFFYRNSPEGYIYLQLLQGLGYVVYLSLQCCNVVGLTANGSFVEKLGAWIQLLGALCIGLHYYVTVFHRAMAHKPPRTCWKVYATYVLVFSVLSFLSRLRRRKKEYLHAVVHGNTHQKI